MDNCKHHGTNAFFLAVSYTVLYTWLRSRRIGCVQFAAVESFYFQKPTGLLFNGPCAKQWNFLCPNMGMGENRSDLPQKLAAHEEVLQLCSTTADVRRVTNGPSCIQSCATPALHNYVVEADVLFSGISSSPRRIQISLDCLMAFLHLSCTNAEINEWNILSAVSEWTVIQIPKLWYHVNVKINTSSAEFILTVFNLTVFLQVPADLQLNSHH